MKTIYQGAMIVCVAAATVQQSAGISILLDYSDSNSSFFDIGTSDGQMARATLNKAAQDLSFAITTQLAAVNANVFLGTAPGTSVTYTTSLNYRDPDSLEVDPITKTLSNFAFAENEFRIYVGATALSGSTLGQGGPAGVGLSLSSSGSDLQWATAISEANQLATETLTRGNPNLAYTTLLANASYGASSASIEFGLAPMVGNLWFDLDRSDSSPWHLDYNLAVPGGSVDLYTVAMHEMLHALGVGIGDLWTKNVSGSTWTGAELQAYLGTDGSGLVDDDHIESEVFGYAIIDGQITKISQESVMTSSISPGERRYLTDLDLAVLRDMGYSTIPEPSMLLLSLAGFSAFLVRRRRD